MRCPNCRCVVPQNTEFCCYCGYDFSCGEAKTLTVTEAYTDRYYNYSDNYGCHGNFAYPDREKVPLSYSYSRSPQYTKETNVMTTETALTLIAGVSSIFLLIMLALLIVLI